MNIKLLTQNAVRDKMRSLFAALYPDRSSDEFERVITSSSDQALEYHQKKEWILEMAKMSLLAENKIAPAKDPQALQKAVADIDELITSRNSDYTDEEFYLAVREQFGSRGLREAKKEIARLDASPDERFTPLEAHQYQRLMMEMWIAAKEKAREKFTPKKYRA